MPKSKQKLYKNKSDKLFSLIIRSRGYCQRCNRSAGVQLQTAHIISRTYSKVRTNEKNAFCLCASCHRFFHNWPREFSRFISEHLTDEEYEELKFKAQDTGKMLWDVEYLRLKELYEGNQSNQ